MENVSYKHGHLISLVQQSGNYQFQISMKETFFENVQTWSLLLRNRSTEEELPIETKVVEEGEEYKLLEGKLNFKNHQQLLLDGLYWDVYLHGEISEEESKRKRIKATEGGLELSYQLLESKEKIFYPYITKKGNFSFAIKDYRILAGINHVFLDGDGSLTVEGYFDFPPYSRDSDSVIETNLIIRNNCDKEELRIPFELGFDEEHNKLDKYFKASFDLKPHVNLTDKKYFKFYVEANVQTENGNEWIESGRLKYRNKDKELLRQQHSFIINDVKVDIRIKPTKKSKFLSVSSMERNFKKELVQNTRKTITKVRRSKRLLKAYQFAFRIFSFMPKDKKLVMFESFHGKQYSDSPRAIYEYMKDHHPEYKLVWSADRRHIQLFREKGLDVIRRFSLKWLLTMPRAKYWVTNARLPLWLHKPIGTKYLQTWHGTPLKRLAADMEEVHMPGTNTEKYKENFTRESSKWDYLVAPNEYSAKIFERAFRFDKEMIESGYPRNDFLYSHNNKEDIDKIKEKLNIPLDKKVIMYAPTWRDNQFYQKGRYRFNLSLDLDRLREELGEEYVVVLRMHYLIAENFDLSPYQGFAYDMSTYEDIRELYLISDILITDYSSVFFDYANLRRPMIFYVYDLDEYRDKLRGFYFDFEKKAPGPLTKTTGEVISEIKKLDKNGFVLPDDFEEFHERFCSWECGESTERVVNQVFK
ncbi:CDP-glycerol glycerophosphotransferase family protein [Thalassobacillus pellis]|uniref:CDP-glycerol glycerophosphotransferase family protein n=1 Tax=Thalassobacillus pellis TaxID=748008 RepID=UPI00195F5EFA|nr:CDP-glycerol glycerophosphotransferase family protein [Thalassobacillus pellis]MBM7551699.1 CDP-glycerol glycerophosphotransferase [Thalassobacillus pellis]